MAKTSKTVLKLNDFVKRIGLEMGTSEAKTSHIFTSYLYELTDVKSYELLPQGESKKGQIDYYYFPEAKDKKDITYYFELKSYKKFKGKLDSKGIKQIKNYLKDNKLPKNEMNRKDNWRIGIYTDLNLLVVLIRRSIHGKKTNTFQIVHKQYNDIPELFNNLNTYLELSIQKIAKKILWDIKENRHKILLDELKKRTSSLHKVAYPIWCKLASPYERGGKGWPKKFKDTVLIVFDPKKETKTPSSENAIHKEKLEKSFNDKKIKKEVIKLFKEKYEVTLRKTAKVFDK